MDAEASAWFESSRESLRADWDAENHGRDDTWDDDGWDDDGWVDDGWDAGGWDGVSPAVSDPTATDPAATDPASGDAASDDANPRPGLPGLDDPVSLPLLSYLAQQVPGDMSGLGLVAGLGTWQRFTGFSTARMWVYLGELHARFTGPARVRLEQVMACGDEDACERAADLCDLAERSLIAEVACELSWSGLRAQGQVEIALILTTDLVKTLDAVAAGVLEVKKAETIARALARESSQLRVRVEDEVLPHASGWTIPTLNSKIREAVLRLAPELAADRARWARKQRGVSFHPEPDDMMRLEARMPVEDGIRVRAALDQATAILNTSRLPGDDRGLNEIRCDVLTGALSTLTATEPNTASTTGPTTGPATGTTTGTATATTGDEQSGQTGSDDAGQTGSGDAGRPGSGDGFARQRARRVKSASRTEIMLTVPLETITGDAEHPGYLARYGPVSAGIARALALDVARDGYWRCAVTDNEHGTLLGLGRSTFSPTYRAPQFLQRFTALRDQTCDFPTCTVPAASCDFDHTIPWPHGTTCECGGGKRCRNHHRLKHETGWNVRTSTDPDQPPGTVIWTSPMGREHLRRPRSIGVPRQGGPETPDTAAPEQARQGRAGRTADPWAHDPHLPELPVPKMPAPVVDPDDSPPPPF